MAVSVIAKITAQPGKRDEVVAALTAMLHHVESEAGTLVYALNADAAENDVLWVYEVYTDQAALEAHSGSDTMKSVGQSLRGLLAGRPELHFGAPIGGKGA